MLADFAPETKVRMVAELHTIQEDENALAPLLTVVNPAPWLNLSSRIFTPSGDHRCRYTAEFPVKAGLNYALLVRSCKNVRIRFDYVRLEIVSLPEE